MGYTDSGSGPAIVMIHGFLFDKSMWAPQIDHFAELGFRVICVDLVGFGKSAGIVGPIIPMSAHTEAIAAVLAVLRIDKAVLVGYSMGGQVVLDFVAAYPTQVGALVLSDTFAGLDDTEVRLRRLALADRLDREGLERYAQEFLPQVLSDRTARLRPTIAARAIEMMTGADPGAAAAALRGRAFRRDYTDTARALMVPALVVVGAEDVFDRGVLGVELASVIPHSRFAAIDHAGHTPSLEAPSAFNAIVADFLAGE
ncbi:alpha/beta fold hydrolase [Nocardia sp. NPDC001965]